MKPKHQRMLLIVIGLCCLTGATALILNNFNDNLVFFFSPTELSQKRLAPGQVIRVGGLVKEGSVIKQPGGVTEFTLTDLQSSLVVTYTGILPSLFREGQGMVAQGALSAEGKFVAKNLLAKHDENYMPPEVAEALKRSGHWNPEEAKP